MSNGNLILSRQRGETIVVEGGIEFTIAEIRGDKVRVAVSAPKHLQVHRKEVWMRIQAASESAMTDDVAAV